MKFILFILGIALFQISYAQDEYELLVNTGHSKKFQDVDISEDDAIMVILGEDEIISIWDIQKNVQLQRIVNAKTFQADYIELTPNGRFLFVFSSKRAILEKYDIQLQKVVDSRELEKGYGHFYEKHHLSISPDGKKIIFIDKGKLQMVATNDLSQTLASGTNISRGEELRFSNKGNFIIHRNSKGVKLFDPETLELKNNWNFPDSVVLDFKIHIYLSPAASSIYLVDRTGELSVYNMLKGSVQVANFGEIQQTYLNDSYLFLLGFYKGQNKVYARNVKTGKFDYKFNLGQLSVNSGAIIRVSKDNNRIYIASCCKGPTINVFDIKTGVLIQTMSGDAYEAQELSFSGRGSQLHLTSNIDSKTWNLKNGTVNSTLDQYRKGMTSEHIIESKTGLYLAMRNRKNGSSATTLDIIDSNKVLIRSIEFRNVLADELNFDNNEKYLWAIATNLDGKFLHRFGIDSASKDLVIEIVDNSIYGGSPMLITKDGLQVIIETHNGFTVYDAESGKIIKTTDDVSTSSWGGNGMMLSNDNKLFLRAANGRIDCYYTEGWNLKYQVEGFNLGRNFAHAWGDTDYFAVFHENGDISLINPETARRDYTIEGKGARIIDCVYDPVHDNFFTLGYDGEIKLCGKNMRNFSLKMIPTRENGFFIIDRNNMYMASKEALKLVHFKNGNEVLTFESLDITNNQPHKILKTIGVANEEEIKLYENAFDKRLKERGFNEVPENILDNIPQLTITSTVPITTKDSVLNFDISAVSKGSKLVKFHCFLNGTRLTTKDGLAIEKPAKEINESYDVALIPGLNHIQVRVENNEGQMSSLENIYLVSTFQFKPKHTYLVAIGISNYENNDFSLEYPAKDAKDIIRYFKKKYIDSTLHILELTDADAAYEKLNEINEFVSNSRIQDELIVFVAGHGVLDEDFNYYFAPQDFNFNQPSEKGWKYDQLEAIFDFAPAAKRLLLIDACHSGAVDKESLFITDEVATIEGVKFRSGANSVGIQQNSALKTFQTMRTSFADLRSQTGTFVLSSTGGAEYAFESKDWNNGVFTYAVLEGLSKKSADLNRNAKVDVDELSNYVRDRVLELTNGKQQPNLREVNLLGSFEIK